MPPTSPWFSVSLDSLRVYEINALNSSILPAVSKVATVESSPLE